MRIEDIDTTRCSPELITACLEDLAWLGITFETAVRIQSRHFTDYTKALDAFIGEGLLYPCFCSRSDVAAASHKKDPDGAPLYAGTCKELSQIEVSEHMWQGKPFTLRMNVQKALGTLNAPLTYACFDEALKTQPVCCDISRWGDVVLMRKDIPTSYHLSVVVDDAMQGITHVVRGKDLEASTDVHVLLQRLLDLPTPLYHHHALLTDDGGQKLSKSRYSETLESLRDRGTTAADIRAMLGMV